MVRSSLLLAIDQFDSGQTAVDFTTGFAARSAADVRVFHVRELPRSIRIPPLETVAEAQLLVDEALWHLRSAGAIAEGRQSAAREGDVAARIVEESARWQCESIILGSRRLRGIGRISGSGVRERVLRSSPLPVIVAPTPTVIRGSGVPSLRAWTTAG